MALLYGYAERLTALFRRAQRLESCSGSSRRAGCPTRARSQSRLPWPSCIRTGAQVRDQGLVALSLCATVISLRSICLVLKGLVPLFLKRQCDRALPKRGQRAADYTVLHAGSLSAGGDTAVAAELCADLTPRRVQTTRWCPLTAQVASPH